MHAHAVGEGSGDEDGLAAGGRLAADMLHNAHHVLPELHCQQLIHLHTSINSESVPKMDR